MNAARAQTVPGGMPADDGASGSPGGPALIVGVGVVIVRSGRYLLGRRRNGDGAGSWGFPGGKVEPGEDPLAAAARELEEETGLVLHAARAAHWSTGWIVRRDASRVRHLTLFVTGDASGAAEVREPDKCAAWGWFSRRDLPVPLFAPTRDFFGECP